MPLRIPCASCGYEFDSPGDRDMCGICVDLPRKRLEAVQRRAQRREEARAAWVAYEAAVKAEKKRRRGLVRERWYRSPEWLEMRAKVIERDGKVCAVCGSPGDNVDHIVPRSKCESLSLDPLNLRVLCWPCNRTKNTKIEIDLHI